MTPTARLQAALDLLSQIETQPRPADAVASDYFRARRYIGSKDRAFVAKTVYDILRHYARLGWWLKKTGGGDQGSETRPPRELLLAYMALVMEKRLKDIGEMCSGGKYALTPLTEEERVFLRRLENHTVEHPEMPEEVKGECPQWAAEKLKARFGKNFGREMKALMKSAPLDLRVNTLKATREAIIAELQKENIKGEPCRLSPLGVRVEERPSLKVLPMLKSGSAEIQDEGSQLVALLVDAKAGQRVVDFCAGAGGKTLAISAQMQNKGRIVACDVLWGRLKRSAERFRRAGLHNIDIRPLKSESDPWVKRHKESYDRVLVDAPCTGTGTWRRNPDARWRSLGPGLDALIPLQASILASAARLVKKGGRLVYATCSLLPDENEKQIAAFLAAHPDFRVVPYKEVWPEGVSDQADFLALTPAQHGTDGFFAAVLERN